MKTAKAMTIRLSEELADDLETFAAVQDIPVSEVIRAAIAQHLDSKRKEPSFQSSLRNRISKATRFLEET